MNNVDSFLELYKQGLSTKDIANKYDISERTIQRVMKENGYIYDRKLKTYVLDEKIKSGDIEKEIDSVVQRTYAIPYRIEKALKLKSLMEDKDAKDIVTEALKNYIETKYLEMF